MSSTAVIAIIVGALVILVTYALVSQIFERKRQERQRLLNALHLRSKDFKHLANRFPEGFLPKDLNILVLQCLMDTCERLCELDPEDKTHGDDLTLYTQNLSELRQRPASAKRKALTSPGQVKEVTNLLQALSNYIANQQQRGLLTEAQAQQYAGQIKPLIMQINLDNYLLNARHALNAQKHHLAIHYYTLAKKLLTRQNGETSYQKQIQQLNSAIANLEKVAAENSKSNGHPAEDSIEWAEFEKESAWQLKSQYDD